MACYSRAIDINPTESVFYSNRAQCLKRLGRADAALKDAQEAV
jgi:Flp pilus assembly protein TadD